MISDIFIDEIMEHSNQNSEKQESEPNVLSNQPNALFSERKRCGEHQNNHALDNDDVLIDNSLSKRFSVHQSNVLYFLFVMSFVLIMGADIAVQRARWSGIWAYGYDSLTFKYLLIFLLNFCLWVDFIKGAGPESVLSIGHSCLNGKQFHEISSLS